MIPVENRYVRNLGLLTPIQQYKLLTKSIAVIGVGGQGGYIAEYLARLGVKEIVLFDPDIYEATNLNRQIFATEETLGMNKVDAAKNAINKINPAVQVTAYALAFDESSVDLVKHCDFVFACADMGVNPTENRAALKTLLEQGIPVVDVAVTLFGAALLSCWKDLEMWDELSEDYCKGTIEGSHEIYQPAYLCAIASALAVHQMVRYFIADYPAGVMDTHSYYDMMQGTLTHYRKPTEPVHSAGYENT